MKPRLTQKFGILFSMIKNVVLGGMLTNKPSFTFKLLKGYLETRLLGRKKIQYLEIMTTHACNAKCDHCSNAFYDVRGRKKQLTPGKVEELIRQAAAMDIPVVIFLGGEPMLDPNIFRYVDLTYQHGMMASLASNGQLFNRDNLLRLKQAHVSNITITVYSTDPEVNDRITKVKGYLENALAAIAIGKEMGIKMALKLVVTREHFRSGEIYRVIDLARKLDLWLSINPIVPTGAANDNYKDDVLSIAEQEELDRLVFENSFITTHLTSNYFGYGCPAGRAYMGVSAYGDVIPCFFLPLSYGNVWDMDLKAIHERMLKTPLFKKGAETCVAAYDPEFIGRILNPCYEKEELTMHMPAPIELHPHYDPEKKTMNF